MGSLIIDGLAGAEQHLRQLVALNPTFLSAEAKGEAIRQLVAIESMATEIRLGLMASAADLVDDSAFPTMRAWLTANTGLAPSHAGRDAQLAAALEKYPYLARAMGKGRVTVDQAHVITHSLDRLPHTLDSRQLRRAEEYLVDAARTYGPLELRVLGDKVLEVIAPDTWEELEAQRLQKIEDSARAEQRLTLKARGDGTTQISGRLRDSVALRLARYLNSLANPRRDTHGSLLDSAGVATVPYPRRAAEAFGELLELVDLKKMPIHGGDATTLLVTISLDQLRTDLSVATLLDADDPDAESRITAGEARRLACNARIVPLVLGSNSEVLDVGRAARFFTTAQERALRWRHPECQGEGCHVPAAWTETHHRIPWARGGLTDLNNAELYCSYHHHLIHHPDWHHEHLTNGAVRFRRRC